jgi:iron complex transport system substrate-binding protein
MRIVSLLPSGTEIVYALGLGGHLVGVSHRCDYPADAASLPVVTARIPGSGCRPKGMTSPFELNMSRVTELQPDVVLTQNICDVCAISGGTVARALQQLAHAPRVIELNAASLDDVLANIIRIGNSCGAEDAARHLVDGIAKRVHKRVQERSARAREAPQVLCLEWLEPLRAAALWVPDLVRSAGGTPLLAQSGQRSSPIAESDLATCRPDIVIAMPCGLDLPTTRDTVARKRLDRLFPDSSLYVFDGRVPSRHGPRLADVVEGFSEIFTAAPGPWAGLLYQRIESPK